uniref:aldehyde dehydrogenase family protein n=1 Tax=uncultured Demequina sp. TaxID=693499 RepID=UPI0025F55D51
MSTPAERFAAAKARTRHHDLSVFEESLSFPLDDFQREACIAVGDGHSVLVAAPTGAGKTIVGEFAVHHCVARGEKAFYTTPIKALSNQKYLELRRAYGDDRVGLLTGDTSINSEAQIVVMTTEVLRNMIYASSPTLDRLGVVVLDEVHYLADRYRGSVWEEVIVHLDAKTAIVSLSATVSNAEEFGAWLTEVRGDTRVIVSERRPVPLWPHVLVREGIFDLYAPGVDPLDPGPTPRLNPELEAITRRQRHEDGRSHPTRAQYRPARGGRRPQGRRSPPRFAVVDVLDRQALLPAIVFVFSRAGCEDAVDQVRASGLRLTSDEEAARIAQKPWAARTAEDRANVLMKWHDLMMAAQDDLGAIMTAEQGKPLAEAKGEIAYGASFVEFFAEEAKRIYGETIPGHQRDKRITVIKQPIGVAASITPWNFPNAMITRKAAP